MSRLMVDLIISLDGYAAADGWPGVWGLEGPEYLAWLEEEAGHEHRVLMGATTYRRMSGFAEEYPDVALELITSRTFDGRLQLLEYVPTVLDGPPGSEAAPS